MSTTDDRLVLGPELAGTLMTPDEFDDAQDWNEEYVYELIHGVLIVTPPPSEGERAPNELLGDLLRDYRKNHPQGTAMDYTLAEHEVRTEGNRRRPDRVIWAGLGRTPKVRRDRPAIVVEFVSEGRRNRRRDYEVKRREYLAAGILEYWIIDRFRRSMTVVRAPAPHETGPQGIGPQGIGPQGIGPQDIAPQDIVVEQNQVYSSPLLPGFELPLSRLFAEADLLESAEATDEE